MILEGRTISPGKAEGRVLKLEEPLSFLGGVDGSTGDVRVGNGGNVAGRVLVFPKGKGSTVGSYVMYDLKVRGKQPAAVVNATAETIVATGAVISSIPMVDSVPVSAFLDGDLVRVDADSGEVEIVGTTMRECVTSVLVSGGRVLFLERPKGCSSFPGRWSLVSGRIEDGEDPLEAARREIMEETRIRVGEPVAALPPVFVREGETIWKAHPFLFAAEGAEPVLDEENVSFEWIRPNDVDRELVDGTEDILASFAKMAPSLFRS